jgi:hypothetical protein
MGRGGGGRSLHRRIQQRLVDNTWLGIYDDALVQEDEDVLIRRLERSSFAKLDSLEHFPLGCRRAGGLGSRRASLQKDEDEMPATEGKTTLLRELP